MAKPRATTASEPSRTSHGTVASKEEATPLAVKVPETGAPWSGAVMLTRFSTSKGSALETPSEVSTPNNVVAPDGEVTVTGSRDWSAPWTVCTRACRASAASAPAMPAGRSTHVSSERLTAMVSPEWSTASKPPPPGKSER